MKNRNRRQRGTLRLNSVFCRALGVAGFAVAAVVMKAKFVLPLVLLMLFGISALAAYSSPKPPSPTWQNCPSPPLGRGGDPVMTNAYKARCQSILSADAEALGSYTIALQPFQANAETSEALLLLSVAICLGFVKWPIPSPLKRGIRLPKVVRVAALVVALAGSAVFTLAALLDFSDFNPLWAPAQPHPADNLPLYSFASSVANSVGLNSLVTRWTDQWTLGHGDFGLIAFSTLALAAASVLMLRMHRGFHKALGDSAMLFVLPTLILFQLGLLWFVPVMAYAQASSFASWTVANVPLVSNRLILISSSGLLALGLFHGRSSLV